MPELTNYRRELFSRYMLACNGNQTKAAVKAGFARRSAYNTGHRLMKDDEVRQRIEELKAQAYEEREITPEIITKAFWDEYVSSTHPRDRQNALDKLAKIRAMYTENINQGGTKDVGAILKALEGHLPEEALEALALRFGIDREPPKPTHEGSERLN